MVCLVQNLYILINLGKKIEGKKTSVGMYPDGLYIDDIRITSTVARDSSYSHDDYNMFLFSSNYYNSGITTGSGRFKFYSLIIRDKDTDVVKHEFIAYKDTNNKPCVYDTVGQKYYYPKNNGVLTYGADKPIPCTNIELSETTITLNNATPKELKYTVTPQLTTDDIMITSENEEIVKIEQGKIIGKKQGECNVVYSCGGASAICKVIVNIVSEQKYKDYLDVTANCVIDTGYVRDSNDNINLIFKESSGNHVNYEVYFGSKLTYVGKDSTESIARIFNNAYSQGNPPKTINFSNYLDKKISLALKKDGLYIDDILVKDVNNNNITDGGGTDNNSIYLFARNFYNDISQANGFSNYRFYGFIVTNSNTGEIKHEFIPKQDSNGNACVYDVITNTYYQNQKDGILVFGTES